MTIRPCVSAIVVTFSSAEYLAKCLSALQTTAADWLRECIVVDNASDDHTRTIVREQFSQATLIASATNLGFGRAMNLGAQRATGDYLLILNPDAAVAEQAIEELVRLLDYRPRAAACGPAIWSEAGRFDYSARRGFPTPLNSMGYLLRLDRLFPSSRRIAGYQQRYLGTDREMMTDSLSGACMLVRRSAFEEIGGFDEDYFLFGEDIDLCWRLKKCGYEIWYVPSARIVHVKGASMKLSPLRARREFYRSMLLFLDKRLKGRYGRVTLGLAKLGIRLAEWISIRQIGHFRDSSAESVGVTGASP